MKKKSFTFRVRYLYKDKQTYPVSQSEKTQVDVTFVSVISNQSDSSTRVTSPLRTSGQVLPGLCLR